MGNITNLRSTTDAVRLARASFVHQWLTNERWSIRKAALALGMNHTTLASRLNATTPFFGEELESIAVLLKQDPVDFYRSFLAAGVPGSEPEQHPQD